MRYARIEENAMDHPKFIAINAGAWRMWCEGNTYCQRQLTDGFIPATAVKGFRYYSAGALKQLLEALVPSKGPLWERVEGGYRMHDYLDWNDAAAKVLKARKDAKDRLDRWKAERDKKLHVTPLSETHFKTPHDTASDVPSKRNGTEQEDQKRTSTAAPRRPKPVEISEGTHGFYCVIAEEALGISIAEDGTDSLGNVSEIFKRLCAQRKVSYDGDVQTKAINAVLVAHEKRAS